MAVTYSYSTDSQVLGLKNLPWRFGGTEWLRCTCMREWLPVLSVWVLCRTVCVAHVCLHLSWPYLLLPNETPEVHITQHSAQHMLCYTVSLLKFCALSTLPRFDSWIWGAFWSHLVFLCAVACMVHFICCGCLCRTDGFVDAHCGCS